MLGIFYGNGCVSSSLNVLCDFYNIKKRYPNIAYSIEMNYMPGELTCFKEFKRLLPSQVLDIVAGKYETRPLLPNGIREYKTDVDRTQDFVMYFSESLKNMRTVLKGRFMLALTGGVDSRTLASLLEYAKIDYECFTLQVANKSIGDRNIPPKIAEKLGRKHQYVNRRLFDFSRKKKKNYKKHSLGMAIDEDYYNYAYGQYEKLRNSCSEPIIILRSNIWEIVECYYGDKFPNKNISHKNMKKAFKRTTCDEVMESSLIQWLDYIHCDDKNKLIDDIDRFYWEVRDGCWLSSIEQACDLVEGIRFFQPCNSRLFQSILFGYGEEERKVENRWHQKKIIQYACPSIADIPYNKDLDEKNGLVNILMRIRKAFRKCYYYCKWYGFKGFENVLADYGSKLIMFYLIMKRQIKNSFIKMG